MAADRDDAELRELGYELVADDRAVGELATIVLITCRDCTNYSKRVQSAILDPLLVRSNSLLDFYWFDLPPRLEGLKFVPIDSAPSRSTSTTSHGMSGARTWSFQLVTIV